MTRLLPRPAAAGLALCVSACLAALLAACGEESAQVARGDVVPARADDQFDFGESSTLLVPTGGLEVRLGEPTTAVAEGDTRQLEALRAPEGEVFVPLTWHYDDDRFAAYRAAFAVDGEHVVELQVDGAGYRLPTPSAQGEGAESFYVLVEGSVDDVTDDLRLSLTFDGVEQTVDLVSGKRDAGAAAALYDLPKRRPAARRCGQDWFDPADGTADFECTYSGPLELPYAAGAWTEEGRRVLGVSLRTSFARYDVLDPATASAAVYAVTRVRNDVRLDGSEPSTVLESDGADNVCPDPATLVCGYAAQLLFDVAKGSAHERVEVEQTYDLVIGKRYAGYDGPARREVVATGSLPLR